MASTSLILSVFIIMTSLCLVMPAVLPGERQEDVQLVRYPVSKRGGDDISKILLKNLRFRETDEYEEPMDKRQKMLVSNLAALLSGLKQRQVEPNMRMPSLRFGK